MTAVDRMVTGASESFCASRLRPKEVRCTTHSRRSNSPPVLALKKARARRRKRLRHRPRAEMPLRSWSKRKPPALHADTTDEVKDPERLDPTGHSVLPLPAPGAKPPAGITPRSSRLIAKPTRSTNDETRLPTGEPGVSTMRLHNRLRFFAGAATVAVLKATDVMIGRSNG